MIILIQCTDSVGLVAIVSAIVRDAQCNIISLREHVDKEKKRFFLRVVTDGDADVNQIFLLLKVQLPQDAVIEINPLPQKKIIVMVSKEYHCLGDILLRNSFKTLGATVEAVIGNHPDLDILCKQFSIPFHLVSYDAQLKDATEKEILEIVQAYQPNYIILAKFMRILSPAFIEQYRHRIINIHHSFLPAFVGAKPYKQAFDRGVKLIGATAHFVTNDLDEGPIIAQQVASVNHNHSIKDMVKAGKEIETTVLAKALQLVFEDRVMVYENKTVVFE